MSSFGPTATTQQGTAGLTDVANAAKANSGTELEAGKGLLASGAPNITAGTNFFNTLLGGNQANTTAMLQPNIDQIRQGNQAQIQALSTLTPRGGGRAGSLFNASYAPGAQIQNLFNGARSTAATTLPQIGLGQEGLGANLFSIGNQPLNTAAQANSGIADIGQRQQQMTQQFWSQLGGGLFNLATTPFGGGAATGGLLGMIHR